MSRKTSFHPTNKNSRCLQIDIFQANVNDFRAAAKNRLISFSVKKFFECESTVCLLDELGILITLYITSVGLRFSSPQKPLFLL
jgi:hypothetical protein